MHLLSLEKSVFVTLRSQARVLLTGTRGLSGLPPVFLMESFLFLNDVDSALFFSVWEEQTVRSKCSAFILAVHNQSCI